MEDEIRAVSSLNEQCNAYVIPSLKNRLFAIITILTPSIVAVAVNDRPLRSITSIVTR